MAFTHDDLATADGHDRYVPSNSKDILSVGHEGVYEWAVEHLVRPDFAFLDFGCGTGYGASKVNAAKATFDGIDSSPSAIDYAQARHAGPGARFFVADLLQPLPNELGPRSYDVVFSSEVVEHVDDPFAFVAAMAAYVKDDGTCFVGTPNRLWSKTHMARGQLLATSHVMEFTPPALRALLCTAFDEVEILLRRLPAGAEIRSHWRTARESSEQPSPSPTRSPLPPRPGIGRCGLDGIPRFSGRRADIAWLSAEDAAPVVAECIGLAAVCRLPKR